MESFTTIQTRVVWPGMLNDQGVLFGGEAMKWLDEVAYICAQRYKPGKLVTYCVENVRFLAPLQAGDIATVMAKIHEVGPLKIIIEASVQKEVQSLVEKAIEARFVFVSLDHRGKPVRLR